MLSRRNFSYHAVIVNIGCSETMNKWNCREITSFENMMNHLCHLRKCKLNVSSVNCLFYVASLFLTEIINSRGGQKCVTVSCFSFMHDSKLLQITFQVYKITSRTL